MIYTKYINYIHILIYILYINSIYTFKNFLFFFERATCFGKLKRVTPHALNARQASGKDSRPLAVPP